MSKGFLALIAVSLLVFSAFAEEASKPANKETAQPEALQGDAPKETNQGGGGRGGGGGGGYCRQYCCQPGYRGGCARWCRSCTTTTPIDAPKETNQGGGGRGGGGGGGYCRQYCCQPGFRGGCARWCRSCTTTTPIDVSEEVVPNQGGGGGGGGRYCRPYCCQQGFRGGCARWCRSCSADEGTLEPETYDVEVQNNEQAQPQGHN